MMFQRINLRKREALLKLVGNVESLPTLKKEVC
jgi:hypothetical protein